jgi:hypothetical protein
LALVAILGTAAPVVFSCSSDSDTATDGTGAAGASGNTGGTGASSSGQGGLLDPGDGGPPSGKDTDGDGVPDDVEGDGDVDGDGIPNFEDPINDGDPPTITLIGISTTFNNPVGIDYHEPTNTVVLSVNYPTGTPTGFERIEFNGDHQQFSNLTGLTEEVKIATARSGNPGGFVVGDLFVGNGVDGQIVRITDNGNSVVNPWVDLPGDNNGLMRGSLYVDMPGTFGGDLVVATTTGEVWRITAAGVPTLVAAAGGVHLEGVLVVPNKPARFGPLAGKIIAGAEEVGLLYVFSDDGTFVTHDIGVPIEDIDLVLPNENFFGVNFGTSRLLGAGEEQWDAMMGDILLTQEHITPGTSGLFRLKWDGAAIIAQPLPLGAGSAEVGQWEHVTFAAAGINEIPPPK